MTRRIAGEAFRRMHPSSMLTEGEYVVLAHYKDEDTKPFVKFRGTFDECADYEDRNESPDNIETYYVAQVIET